MNAERRIRELVSANLSDSHEVAGVRFVDALLLVAAEVGTIRCSLVGDRELRFQTADQPPWEVELERAKSKLRMLCARLGVLCNESGGQEVSLYGGEGIVENLAPGKSLPGPERWAVRFKNTPSEQEFVIQTIQAP